MLKKELHLLQVNKLSNKILCNKSFVRKSSPQDPRINVVDSYDRLSTFNIKSSNANPLTFSIGNNISSSFYIYKSIKNSFFQFESLNFLSKTNFFSVKYFLNTLLSFQSSKTNQVKNTILREGFILYPTKRGYFCYLMGLIGFFPKHQISFLLDKKSNTTFIYYPFLSKFFLKKIRMFISEINIKFHLYNKKIRKNSKSKGALKNKKFKLIFLANPLYQKIKLS
jgi:hypothetical protein